MLVTVVFIMMLLVGRLSWFQILRYEYYVHSDGCYNKEMVDENKNE